jgi:hypothetical protein
MKASAKPSKTVADYLAMAVAPAWIIAMVGSLMLFLIEAIYRGPYEAEVRWTLCWFILAAVLVSRISIQQGTAYATVYGVTLGAATAFRLSQFIGLHIAVLLLIGFLWWCASKLTWDCTLLDDDADASGEGLLDRAGWQQADSGPPPVSLSSSSSAISTPTGSKQAHAPGLWVVYFSLGAIPVFGLGQLAIPLDDPSARFRGFLWLCVYLGSAMGLLFTTSFLGLRRYLRQRRLLMPAPVARLWLGLGAVATVAIMIGTLFLPRPEAADTLADLAGRLSPSSKPEAPHAKERWEEDAESTREADQSGEQGTLRPRDVAESDPQLSAKPAPDSGQPAGGDQPRGGGSAGGAQTGPAPMMGETPTQLVAWLRWLTVAAGVLLALVVLLRLVPQWLERLRHRKARTAKAAGPSDADPFPRRIPFAAYPDPFTSGRAAQMSPTQLTKYTFEALQAWAAERGCIRRPEQTPAEFGGAVAELAPTLSREVLGSVRLYQRIAYASEAPTSGSLEILQRLWSGMTRA